MAAELPHLEDVERLSPRVIRILGGNPSKYTLQGTNTYLLGAGHNRLLIDTAQGLHSWTSALARTLASESCTISHALLTHWHPDHTSGVESLLTLCPEAKVHKNTPSDDNLPINDGDIFAVEGAAVKAAHTPGHTVDHMAFWLEEEGAMFSGDNVLGHGTSVFEDYTTYLTSLEKMKSCFLPSNVVSEPEPDQETQAKKVSGRIYPAHGAVIQDGAAKIQEYIDHRKLRERQILDALTIEKQGENHGHLTSSQIVKIVYRDTPENLHDAAKKGVEQILRKMRGEGKVDVVVVGGGGTVDDEDVWEVRLKGRM